VPLHVEPVMHVVIIVPPECNTAVLATVSRSRGRIVSSEYGGGAQTVRARVPQAEVPGFISTLMRQTDGQARTSMVLFEYWPVAGPAPGDPIAGVREPRPKAPVLRSGAISLDEP
jgi:translation elongation factor EF-G